VLIDLSASTHNSTVQADIIPPFFVALTFDSWLRPPRIQLSTIVWDVGPQPPRARAFVADPCRPRLVQNVWPLDLNTNRCVH